MKIQKMQLDLKSRDLVTFEKLKNGIVLAKMNFQPILQVDYPNKDIKLLRELQMIESNF